jgi:hypothetical protein
MTTSLKARIKQLYNSHWSVDYKSLEDLKNTMVTRAFNGSYRLVVYFQTQTQWDEITSFLTQEGFNYNPYNGNPSTIEIDFL